MQHHRLLTVLIIKNIQLHNAWCRYFKTIRRAAQSWILLVIVSVSCHLNGATSTTEYHATTVVHVVANETSWRYLIASSHVSSCQHTNVQHV